MVKNMDEKKIQSKGQTKPTSQQAKKLQVSQVPSKAKNISKKETVTWNFPFTKKNFIIAGIGLVVIIIGYILMATGISNQPALESGTPWNNPFAVTVAPILLLIGYCIIIPYSIIKYFGKNKDSEQ